MTKANTKVPVTQRAAIQRINRLIKSRGLILKQARGRASHGTSEFYKARAAITRRLIVKHGFNIVAVEADWPDAARIDRYIRHHAHKASSEDAFARFPSWRCGAMSRSMILSNGCGDIMSGCP